jgi:streptothricin acetyltransferase
LKVETQNINAAACHFYARQGCTLGGINRFAYPLLPLEVQLLWYKDLIDAETN